MKKIIIGVLITSVTCVIACKKKDNESVTPASPAPQVPTCLIAATIDSLSKDTSSLYVYDSDGRLSKEQYYDKNVRDGYYLYSYGAGTIKQLSYDNLGKVEDTAYYTLNADGTVAKETYKGGSGRFDTLLFAYENGYLKTTLHRSSKNGVIEVDTFNYEYAGGNMTKFSYIENGVVNYSYVYTYTALADKVGLDLSGDISMPGLFGKANANLILSETYTNTKNPTGNYKQSYSYKVDADGLPLQQKITTDYGNANPQNNLFTTRCK